MALSLYAAQLLADGLGIRGPAVSLRRAALVAGLRMPTAAKALRELEACGFVLSVPTGQPSGPAVSVTGPGAEHALALRNARALARKGAA